MSVGVVNKQTGDRIPTAGMPAIDSVLSGSSTNPVQNRVVKAALDEKTDTDLVASDFDATASYTAGNYCIYEGKFYRFKNNHSGAWAAADVDEIQIAGELSSIKSGLTTLDNEVNGDATTYPYADVITIEDAVPANVAECNVKIEPDQNLHGYDHPWVGGAGKNKQILTVDEIISGNGGQSAWSNNTRTINDIVYTILTDDSNNVIGIKLNGTANANTLFEFPLVDLDGNYTVNGCPTGGGAQSYRLDLRAYDGGVMITDTGSGATSGNIQISARCVIRIESGTVCDNIVFRPMICLSTETDATFAPYTNICPITGHTEASVETVGNIFSYPSNIDNNIRYLGINVGDGNFTLETTAPKVGNASYLFLLSGNVSSGADNTLNNVYSGYSRTVASINGYVTVAYRNIANATPLTAYTTYLYKEGAKRTYTIALGDTIYGGTVRIDSNGNTVMDVDRAVVDAGDLTYNEGSVAFYSSDITDFKRSGSIGNQYATYCISSAFEYHGNSDYEQDANGFSLYYNPSVPGCRLTFNKTIFDGYTTTQFKQWLTDKNVQICYELATPFTIQLTPTQIQLLKGTNTLTASTGQISVTVNGVSGAIGSLQTQANTTDEALAELVADIADKLPTAPTTDGAYVLTVTVADGTPTYSWESAT